MKRKIFITLLLPLMIISNVFVTVKAEDGLDYNEGIIYKPSRYTVEYVEKNDFPDLTAYDLHLNNKVNNLEQYLLSLCIEKNYYEYSDGTTLREYTSEIIPQLYPKFKEIIEITKSDYEFSVSYVTTDGKEVYIDYKDNDVMEKIVYDESSDTAYHYYDGKYSIEYHFREPYSISMSEELSNRLDVLLEQGKYDEIEDIKGLILYQYDDGSYAIDIDTDYIVRTYNAKNNNADKSAPTNDSELLASLKNAFPDYTNKVKTNQQLMCSALNRSVAVKVTETRNNYKKASGNWFAFAAKTALDVIKAQTKYSKSKIKGILSFLNIVISVSEQISKAASISSSATYSFHATKRGCVYDSTVQNGYVLVVRYLDNSKRFNGQYNESGSFYWTQEYTSVLAMSDSTVLNTALNNYNNDLLTNNLLCTYYPEYYQWSD